MVNGEGCEGCKIEAIRNRTKTVNILEDAKDYATKTGKTVIVWKYGEDVGFVEEQFASQHTNIIAVFHP